MTSKRVVIAAALVGLVTLGVTLIGQQRAPAPQPAPIPIPQAAPAARVDARSLVPRDAILYVEVKDLAATWQGIKAGPLYQELLQTAVGQQLQVLAAAVQAQSQVTVGAPLDQVVTGLLGERVILAAWLDQGAPVGAFLSQVQDPAFAQTVLAAARQADVTAGKVARYDQETYGNHTIYVKVPVSQQAEPEQPKEEEAPAAEAEVRGPLGRPRPVLSRVRERRTMGEAASVARRARKAAKLEYSALCGNVLMASDNLPALKLLIDRFDQPQPDSVLANDTLQAALGTLPAGAKAVAFVDFEKALAQVPLDEENLLSGKRAVAQFLGRQFLSVVRSLRQAVAGVYLSASGAEVRLRVTRDPALLTDGMRAVFSQENVTPRAASYISEDTVLFASLPRISAQMKLVAEAVEVLFPASPDEPGTAQAVQPIRPLDLIFGRNFTREVLPGIGPEISLLVEANPARAQLEEGAQGIEHMAAQLTVSLFVQLGDDVRPEVRRVIESALGVFMTGARQGFGLGRLHAGNATGYVIQPKKMSPRSLNQLIQPTIAFTDGFLVLSNHPSALESSRSPSERQPRRLNTDLSGHLVVFADLSQVVKALEAFRPLLVMRGVKKNGMAPAEAQRKIGNVFEFLRPLAGQMVLTVQHTPAETQATLRLRTATPLFAGEAQPQGR